MNVMTKKVFIKFWSTWQENMKWTNYELKFSIRHRFWQGVTYWQFRAQRWHVQCSHFTGDAK